MYKTSGHVCHKGSESHQETECLNFYGKNGREIPQDKMKPLDTKFTWLGWQKMQWMERSPVTFPPKVFKTESSK
jgi:hypothetical protein